MNTKLIFLLEKMLAGSELTTEERGVVNAVVAADNLEFDAGANYGIDDDALNATEVAIFNLAYNFGHCLVTEEICRAIDAL